MPADDDLPLWLRRHRWAVGERIRDLRRGADLSQVELGALAGMDHKTVSRIETGTTATDLDQIACLAAALQVPSSQLFPSEGPPAPQRDAGQGRQPRRAAGGT